MGIAAAEDRQIYESKRKTKGKMKSRYNGKIEEKTGRRKGFAKRKSRGVSAARSDHSTPGGSQAVAKDVFKG